MNNSLLKEEPWREEEIRDPSEAPQGDVSMIVHRGPGKQPGDVTVVPLQVCEQGIKVKSQVALPFEEELSVELHVGDGHAPFTFDCKVDCIRPSGEEWIISFNLHNRLDDRWNKRISALCQGERRGAERIQVELLTELKTPGKSESLPVTLLDLSDRGLRIVLSKELPIGEPVMLTMKLEGYPKFSLLAKTRWVRSMADRYLAGCEVSNHSLGKFQATLAGLKPQLTAASRRTAHLKLTAVGILFAAIALISWNLLS